MRKNKYTPQTTVNSKK